MSNHTRRHFLGLIASLLTLVDAVRRFFQPPEVVKDHVDDWPEPGTGPYCDYYDPLARKLSGTRAGMTYSAAFEDVARVLKASERR